MKIEITDMDADDIGALAITVMSPHADYGDRFYVGLAISYRDRPEVQTPKEAAAYALAMTRDATSADTIWFVYDRHTGRKWLIDQDEFEHLIDERDLLKS